MFENEFSDQSRRQIHCVGEMQQVTSGSMLIYYISDAFATSSTWGQIYVSLLMTRKNPELCSNPTENVIEIQTNLVPLVYRRIPRQATGGLRQFFL